MAFWKDLPNTDTPRNSKNLSRAEKYHIATAVKNGDFKIDIDGADGLEQGDVIKVSFRLPKQSGSPARLSIDNGNTYKNIDNFNAGDLQNQNIELVYQPPKWKRVANDILNLVYPVGRGFIDFTDEDYSDYLGFTWERTLLGVVPVGKDSSQVEFDTLGKTGGEKVHTLSVNEMPRHSHSITTRYNAGAGAYNVNGVNNTGVQTPDAVQTAGVGGGQAHNNLQPYEVVNYWKRIA